MGEVTNEAANLTLTGRPYPAIWLPYNY
jgi:hypothetical protein